MSVICSKEYTVTIAAAPATNLIAYWKCEESAVPVIDSTGHTNLTQLTGSFARVAGKIAFGFSLDGCELMTASTTRFRFTGSFTIRFWLYDAHTLGGMNLVYNDDAGDYSFKIEGNTGIGTNGLNWSVWDAANTETTVNATSGVELSLGWHRVIVWYDSGAGQIGMKIDNDPNVTTAQAGGIYATTGDEFVACAPGLGSLTGYIIDEIGVWDRILTAAEMLTDWNGGVGKTYPDVPL